MVLKEGLKAAGAEGVVVKGEEGKEWKVSSDVVNIERKVFKQSSMPFLLYRFGFPLTKLTATVREFTPNVIEPSFGLGRILYALLEHSFWAREQDVERGVRSISLPPFQKKSD